MISNMGTAISTIDKRIHKYVAQMNAKDKEAVLGIVMAIAEKQDTEPWKDEAFIEEMDRRFKEMESGKVKLYTLDEVEAHARQAFKTRKRKKQ